MVGHKPNPIKELYDEEDWDNLLYRLLYAFIALFFAWAIKEVPRNQKEDGDGSHGDRRYQPFKGAHGSMARCN